MLAIPPEMLEEAGLAEGDVVTVRSRAGLIEVEPGTELSADFVQWLHRMLRKHDAAWRELADA